MTGNKTHILFLDDGFRIFFFAAALWAFLAMAIWIVMLTGTFNLSGSPDTISWHAHEFLFGYLSAVIAGFLFTAIPNWTGRQKLKGFSLAVLFAAWMMGRVAFGLGGTWPDYLIAIFDLIFPILVLVLAAREIILSGNWRNLIVIAAVAILILGNVLFHWELASGEYAAQGNGLRIGLAAAIFMISIIGGRIIPSFTRNWLTKRNESVLPVSPMAPFDILALAVLVVTLVLWTVMPEAYLTGTLLLGSGVLHLIRLGRWKGYKTGSEPLLWVLHIAYFFIPLGCIMLGLSIIIPGSATAAAAQHIWMAGAIGLMTMAIMTRATLGHTGQELSAGSGTVFIYAMLIVSVSLRILADYYNEYLHELFMGAGLVWMLVFAGFVAIYGPLLLGTRIDDNTDDT